MKLVIDLPENLSGLIHCARDENVLISLMRNFLSEYVDTTPRLKKNKVATKFIVAAQLSAAKMEIRK